MSFDNNIDFKDHIVQYPNRFKQTTVAPGIVELVPTWIETPSQILQPGTPVDSELFKKLKQNVTIYQQTFTTTNNQTVINLDRDFLIGQNRVSLSIGGVRQYTGQDYTETDTHTLTMTAPLKGGLKAEVIMFTASQAIAEDLVEQTLAALEATEAANEAAVNANSVYDATFFNWLSPVNTFSDLSNTYPNPKQYDTVWIRDTGRAYRFEGTAWKEKLNANPTLINEVDNRLTTQINTMNSQVRVLGMQPLFVETLASLGRFGTGTPAGVSNYSGGNYVLTVNGNAGDNFFTVVSGNIAHAGSTNNWAAVLEKTDLTYDGYQVTGTDGINKVYVYPAVRESISGAVLANVHDQAAGVHYTERGYKAFAQHIEKNAGYHSQRTSYIARFLGSDSKGSWSPIGGLNTTFPGVYYARGMNPIDLSDATGGILTGDNDKSFTFNTDTVGEGVEWEVSLSKLYGYFEGFFGVFSGSPVIVEFYLDDVLQETKTINRAVERVVFDFKFAEKGKIVVKNTTATPTTVRVGNCYWWNAVNIAQNVFNTQNKKAVYLGDSWGMYHNQTTPREIERVWRKTNPNAVVVNHSKSGMTTKYAVAWFDEYVIQEKPDIVIIEYFTNDITYIIGANQGIATFLDPDGNTVEVDLTEEEYFSNLRYMISEAIAHGIQPVIILPAVTAGNPQTQVHAQYAAKMQNGGSFVPLEATFNKVESGIAKSSATYTDKVETLTEFNVPLSITPGHAGVVIQPRVKTYDGTFLQVKDNDGTVVFDLQKNQLVGLLLQSLELTGIFGEQGLKLPNSQLVDNLNVLKLKARAGKTINSFELGEGTKFIQNKAPMRMYAATVLPVASYDEWGNHYWIKGASGVSDRLCVCIKDASNNYVWKDLF